MLLTFWRISRWLSVQANLHVGGKSAGFANPAGAAGGRRVVVFVIPQVVRIDASHVLAGIEMAFRSSESTCRRKICWICQSSRSGRGVARCVFAIPIDTLKRTCGARCPAYKRYGRDEYRRLPGVRVGRIRSWIALGPSQKHRLPPTGRGVEWGTSHSVGWESQTSDSAPRRTAGR